MQQCLLSQSELEPVHSSGACRLLFILQDSSELVVQVLCICHAFVYRLFNRRSSPWLQGSIPIETYGMNFRVLEDMQDRVYLLRACRGIRNTC